MLQVTYISTATGPVTDAEVDAILALSRHNNAAAGVTGLLLYDGRRFLQALEGEAAAVERTLSRIRIDARHKAVVLLGRTEIATRAFGDWAMAARRAQRGPGGEDVAAAVDRLTATVANPSLQATFRSFARVRAAA